MIVNNRGHAPTALHSGLHVFSNGQPEEEWFKTEKLRGRLRQEVLPLIAENSAPEYWQEAAFAVMSDKTPAPENKLPETGVAKQIERALSSIYIEPIALFSMDATVPTYGTRTQSTLTLNQSPSPIASEPILRAQLQSREYE